MSALKNRKTLIAALGLAAVTFAAPQALAQTQSAPAQDTPAQNTPTVQAPAQTSQNFPDDKLKSFAVAYLQVDKITQEYLPKMKEAKDTTAKEQVRTEAGEKMVKAVEGAPGISVDEYNQIAQSAQTDPDLANKITGYIRDANK